MLDTLRTLLISALLGITLSTCGYSGIAATGDAVVITRNDWILFGLARQVYVCRITPTGVQQCSSDEDP